MCLFSVVCHDVDIVHFLHSELTKLGPLSSNGQHYEIDDCPEDNREDY